MKLKYIVDKEINIRQVLREKFGVSERLLTKLKKNKKIYLNGNNDIFLDIPVKSLDIVEVDFDFDEDNSNIVPVKIDLNVIYEDDSLIVLDKPFNMPVHPSLNHYEDSLSNGLKYYYDSINLHRKIRPINRLDKDTSGIVIFAKNEYAQDRIRITNKIYLTILEGKLEGSGTIDKPIARKTGSIIERCIDTNGENAISHYEVIDTDLKNNLSIVKFILETGRTHQIRVHSKFIGHSILGDTLYGNASKLISRQALHCLKMSFIHPITNKKLNLLATIPNDFKQIKINKPQ